MNGVEMIAAERERQIREKGWTAEHDDTEHGDGELLWAGLVLAADLVAIEVSERDFAPPWIDDLARHVAEKYGADRVRRLVIAGALIAAEIDRLQRADASS